MGLEEFLRYGQTSAGINIIVGYLLSFLVEVWPAYGGLSERCKRAVIIGLGFVIPVACTVGLWLVSGEAVTVDAVWSALAAGFSAYFGSQVAHARQLAAAPPGPAGPAVLVGAEELFGEDRD